MPSASSSTSPRVRDHRAYYLANRERKLEYSRQYRARNPEKVKADNAKWMAENVEKRREYIRASMAKSRYGVTRQQHKGMMEAQGHRCAICNVHQSELKRRFCIDHDHATGKVRGLVCNPCNSVLGHARDKIEVLQAAIAYLEQRRT